MINLNKNDKNVLGKIKTLPVWLVLPAFLLLLVRCNGKRVIYTPRGYDITKGEKYNLGTKLNEISGICWINDTLMLANNDESGKIFAIPLNDMSNLEYRNIRFSEKADYEDIVKVDSAIYILVSTGKIIKVTNYQDESAIRATEVAVLPGSENEFETLYYDKDINSLIMLCKDCHKEKNRVRSAYRFDLKENKLIDTPYYQIDMNRVRKVRDDNEAIFRPSAAAINPIDNKVYIVSPLGNLMVVTDKKGKVEQAFKISGLDFPQPEGITFAANGDMYISNEIGDEAAATLWKFTYRKPK